MDTALIGEGLRIARLSLWRKLRGWKRYPGDIPQICDGILNDCWNGRYYQASAGHFCQFYTRDFGIASPFLEKEKSVATLRYALERFSKRGRVTTSITPSGRCFDFPVFAPDSLAFLFRALSVAKDKQLLNEYRGFLQEQIDKWCRIVLDDDGFVRRNIHFSSMRDHSIRSSSCYDNSMALLLKEAARSCGFRTGITLTASKFIKEFWADDHFKDERDTDTSLSGDANVVPFWLGIIDNKKMARLALHCLDDAGMTLPVPLAYSPSKAASPKMIKAEMLVPNWEGDTRWMQLGLMYAAVAKKNDKQLFEKAKQAITNNIRKNQNILEVFTKEGKPYTSLFYHADEGMLWGAALSKSLF